MTSRIFIVAILIVQVLCAIFFLSNLVISIFGLPPISWQAYEAIEVGAALGLILGTALGGIALKRSLARTAKVEAQLRVASGAFMVVLEERFVQWGLTPAERDVALFAIKGLSLQDIAALRNTSEGTVKAQTNAIYRKAGVSGRPQLLSLFIEDLMGEAVSSPPKADLPARQTASAQ